MMRSYRCLLVERRPDVFCVRLRSHRLMEADINALTQELIEIARAPERRGLALALGPKPPERLYSVFLSKLYGVQRVVREQGGALFLCEVDPIVRSIFEARQLDDQFHFVRDFDEATRTLTT